MSSASIETDPGRFDGLSRVLGVALASPISNVALTASVDVPSGKTRAYVADDSSRSLIRIAAISRGLKA
jgi:hypothetical protein